MDEAELEALGLYDPTAPGAADRLTLLRLALHHGATVDDIRAAISGDRLHALAAERVMLDRAPRLSLAGVARQAGVDPAFATRIWRALGFVVPDADAAVCTDADIDVLAFYETLRAGVGEDSAVSQARVAGAALSRSADAAIQMVRTDVEAPIREAGGSDAELGIRFVELASSLVPRVYPMFEAVHRRHLVEAARRYSIWGTSPTAMSTTQAVIGFADLVGYTSLNQQLTPEQLGSLIDTFEQRVLDAVARPGARLVKVIGDEAMFVAATADDAATVAQDLLAAAELPAMRIGVAAGMLLSRDGDLFGTVVNRAARLERLAEPGQALCDADTAGQLAATRVAALGPRTLAGFDEPVEVFALRG